MPIWGWVCIGLVVAVALALTILVVVFEKKKKRLRLHGQTVVARILLANPSLYTTRPEGLEGAFVVFTRDNDASEEHLAFLEKVCKRLEKFTPDRRADADERRIASALASQKTVAKEALRLPKRVTDGREVFFSTPNVFRDKLPDGKLTRDYIYLQILIDDQHCDVLMTEYPDEQNSDDDEE